MPSINLEGGQRRYAHHPGVGWRRDCRWDAAMPLPRCRRSVFCGWGSSTRLPSEELSVVIRRSPLLFRAVIACGTSASGWSGS